MTISWKKLVATMLAVLWSLGGCKYTGGDSDKGDKQAQKSAEQASDEAKKAQDEKGAAKADKKAGDKAQEDGLGEGTDEQLALLTRAKKAWLTEDMERAETLFEKLADTGPLSGSKVSGIIALADIYNETDRPKKALELYEGLAAEVEDLPEVQIVIARALADMGETSRAIGAYKKLLRAQPDYVFALIELGELYAKAGQDEKAAKSYYKYEQKVYKMADKLEKKETPPGDKLHILDVFSLVSDDRAAEATIAALGDEEPVVRRKAAVVLGQTGATDAIDLLEKVAVNDPSRGVRMAAKGAIKELEKAKKAGAEGKVGPEFVEDKDKLPAE